MARKTTKSSGNRTKMTSAKRLGRSARSAIGSKEPRQSTKAVSVKVRKSYATVIVVLFLVVALGWLARSLLVAAIVNGQPIMRFSVIGELEKQGGKQALNSLITKTLILQEAKRRGITVSGKDVDDQYKKIEADFKKQGRDLNQTLMSQGMTQNHLREQIRLQKMIEKMLAKDIQVSDKEINDYIAKNTPSQTGEENVQGLKPPTKEEAKDQLRRQKLSEKFQTFLSDLQKKAKISYFVNY